MAVGRLHVGIDEVANIVVMGHGECGGISADLAAAVDLTQFEMAIIMSHHLESDRTYLRQLAATDIGYIGLLGPAQRRERLLAELGDDVSQLEKRLHGPAGLDIGGRGPASIALSIIAQMQQYLAAR